jgi:hypothetical protein
LRKEDFSYRLRHHLDFLSPAEGLQEGPFLAEDLINDTWDKVKQTLNELGRQILDATARYLHGRELDSLKTLLNPPNPE